METVSMNATGTKSVVVLVDGILVNIENGVIFECNKIL